MKSAIATATSVCCLRQSSPEPSYWHLHRLAFM